MEPLDRGIYENDRSSSSTTSCLDMEESEEDVTSHNLGPSSSEQLVLQQAFSSGGGIKIAEGPSNKRRIEEKGKKKKSPTPPIPRRRSRSSNAKNRRQKMEMNQAQNEETSQQGEEALLIDDDDEEEEEDAGLSSQEEDDDDDKSWLNSNNNQLELEELEEKERLNNNINPSSELLNQTPLTTATSSSYTSRVNNLKQQNKTEVVSSTRPRVPSRSKDLGTKTKRYHAASTPSIPQRGSFREADIKAAIAAKKVQTQQSNPGGRGHPYRSNSQKQIEKSKRLSGGSGERNGNKGPYNNTNPVSSSKNAADSLFNAIATKTKSVTNFTEQRRGSLKALANTLLDRTSSFKWQRVSSEQAISKNPQRSESSGSLLLSRNKDISKRRDSSSNRAISGELFFNDQSEESNHSSSAPRRDSVKIAKGRSESFRKSNKSLNVNNNNNGGGLPPKSPLVIPRGAQQQTSESRRPSQQDPLTVFAVPPKSKMEANKPEDLNLQPPPGAAPIPVSTPPRSPGQIISGNNTSNFQEFHRQTEQAFLRQQKQRQRASRGQQNSESEKPVVLNKDSQLPEVDFEEEYDIIAKIGEGWFSRVYLAESRVSQNQNQEIVLKSINSDLISLEDFLREYEYTQQLSSHRNILSLIVPNVVFQSNGSYTFATEYAPFGDLTSNISASQAGNMAGVISPQSSQRPKGVFSSPNKAAAVAPKSDPQSPSTNQGQNLTGVEGGIGELCTKRVAKQIGSALEWVHSKGLCHLDVKLDNILVFKSDFSWVKLCDFGSVRRHGDIIVKKHELLPYCPPELLPKRANDYYRVDRAQDVFQFGVVLFFCLSGILPWQRADPAEDPNYAEFHAWRTKKSSKPPRYFKPLTSRAQKLFRKLMDVDPTKRLRLGAADLGKYLDDKWLKKVSTGKGGGGGRGLWGANALSDGISQLTMGSFQSCHSNAAEKNKVLFTLLQHGVETTVDRTQKNSRIINWIKQGYHANSSSFPSEVSNPGSPVSPNNENSTPENLTSNFLTAANNTPNSPAKLSVASMTINNPMQ